MINLVSENQAGKGLQFTGQQRNTAAISSPAGRNQSVLLHSSLTKALNSVM